MSVIDLIKKGTVYLDGGMGSLLQKQGLKPGEYPERWNITHSDVIVSIQRDYYNAGTNIVCSNTFGANCFKFDDEELKSVIFAAIQNAKEAARLSGKDFLSNGGTPEFLSEKYVALDIGSLGRLLKPYGDLPFEEAVAAFAKTVRLGVEAGADLIFIETMNDSYETKAALLAAKENSDLPVFVSNAYGEDGKLMTGAEPKAMVAMLEGMGADAIGVNCSLGPKQLVPVIEEYLKYASVPVLFKPNAGLPKLVDGKTVYDISPDEFATEVAECIKKGIRLAGGCCGTTPEYIDKVVKASKGIEPVKLSDKDNSLISSYTHAVEFGNSPILIGERINPTGKKRFKEALRNHDIDYILSEGAKQQDAGVHVLDVNVGLPEIDEPALLKEVCYELQAIIDLPLQIDTTDIVAMEAALRAYNGKALINSVNGKEESMAAVFPLVKKYGGVVVCLTLDEDGIPSDAEGRVRIAEKIINKAAEYGIKKKDLLFDTLAMAVSAGGDAAIQTLNSLDEIRHRLGCNTSLGVSNISFGLPSRDAVNSVFFACALERGLSAAIMNPNSSDMMKTYFAFRALHLLDENCMEYIENIDRFVSAAPASPVVPSGGAAAGADSRATSAGQNLGENKKEMNDVADTCFGANNAVAEELKLAIVKGRKEQAGKLTTELLNAGAEPLDVVSKVVIPALDVVGIGFEKKTMYLPQLLMSAEASSEAFEVIKSRFSSSESSEKKASKGKFVIATVKGDIHDIGKNIVKLILENYGFEVIDLGKDVAPETVLEAVEKTGAGLVGLSALMTTTVPAMEDTIKLLKEKAPQVKTFVGGAVLTEEYARKMGADFYGRDAMATVREALSVVEK